MHGAISFNYILYSTTTVFPAIASILSLVIIEEVISVFVINIGVIKDNPLLLINSLSIFNIGVPALTLIPASANCSNPSPFSETVSIPT